MKALAVLLMLCSIPLAGEDALSTQSGITIPTGNWVQIDPASIAGVKFDIPGWEELHYVPSMKALCVLANYYEFSGEPQRAWICYDPRTNNVTLHDLSGYWHTENLPDGGHPTFSYAIDPARSLQVGICCNSAANVAEGQRRWTWEYDFFGQAGRPKFSNSSQGDAYQGGGAVDPVTNRLITIDGDSGFVGTSYYDIAANAWSVGVAGLPASAGNWPFTNSINPMMARSDVDGKMYQFGGLSSGNPDPQYLFRYTPSSNTWANLSPAADPTYGLPPGREAAVWVYLKSENKFLLYGGDGSGPNPLNDTWIYDPVANNWTRIITATLPTLPAGDRPWDRGAYYPPMDITINLRRTRRAYEFWAFRRNPGTNIGYMAPATAAQTAGSYNRSNGEWAGFPTVVADTSTVYNVWAETQGSNVSNPYDKPHARSVTGGVATDLGALDATSYPFAGISTALVGSTLWSCYDEGGSAKLIAKSYSGGVWTGGYIDPGSDFVGQCSLADVGGVPHIAYTVATAASGRQVFEIRVSKFVTGAWVDVGTRLNVNSSNSRGGSPSIISDGTNPCVAWDEYTLSAFTATSPKVYVKCWDGSSSWVLRGSYANVSTSNDALFPSLGVFGGALHVAFTEKTRTGLSKAYLRSFDGTNWNTLGGGDLNRDADTGWVFRPRVACKAAYGCVVVMSEQGIIDSPGPSTWWLGSYGQRPQITAYLWNGSTMAKLGGSLNADAVNGSATQPQVAMMNTTPVVTWRENNQGAFAGVYSSQWDGNNWVPLSAPTCSISPSSAGPYTAGQVVASPIFSETSCAPSLTWSAAGLSGSGLTLNSSTGAMSGTAVAGTYSVTVTYDTASVGPFTLTVNAAPSVTSSSLTAGTQGFAYDQTIATTGGTGSVTCSGSGAPAGLTIQSNCHVTGTPTTPGSYTMSVTPADANLISGSAHNVSLAISSGGAPSGMTVTGSFTGTIRE